MEILIGLIAMKKSFTRDFINELTFFSFMYFLVAMFGYDCSFCFVFIFIDT